MAEHDETPCTQVVFVNDCWSSLMSVTAERVLACC